jgi:hypothetical protein
MVVAPAEIRNTHNNKKSKTLFPKTCLMFSNEIVEAESELSLSFDRNEKEKTKVSIMLAAEKTKITVVLTLSI